MLCLSINLIESSSNEWDVSSDALFYMEIREYTQAYHNLDVNNFLMVLVGKFVLLRHACRWLSLFALHFISCALDLFADGLII